MWRRGTKGGAVKPYSWQQQKLWKNETYQKFNRKGREVSSCLWVLTKKANVQAEKKKVKQRKEEEQMAMVDFDGSSPLIWKSRKGMF